MTKKDATKSLELLPTGEGHELLGRLYLQEGNTKKAQYHFEIASNADSAAGKRARYELSKLPTAQT